MVMEVRLTRPRRSGALMSATDLYSLVFALCVLSLTPFSAAAQATDTTTAGKTREKPIELESEFLDGVLVVPAGVFSPREAERYVLPFIKAHAELFRDASVMEIGTGSGIVSLYAAQLGAKKVVATDISPEALETASANAERLG